MNLREFSLLKLFGGRQYQKKLSLKMKAKKDWPTYLSKKLNKKEKIDRKLPHSPEEVKIRVRVRKIKNKKTAQKILLRSLKTLKTYCKLMNKKCKRKILHPILLMMMKKKAFIKDQLKQMKRKSWMIKRRNLQKFLNNRYTPSSTKDKWNCTKVSNPTGMNFILSSAKIKK